MQLQAILSDIGLKDKEAKVYLALLELGPSLVSSVARKSGTNRVTTYHVLEKLIQIGYASQAKTEDIQYFSAVDPVEIVEQVNEKARKVTAALEPLKRMQNMHENKARIHTFRGLKGIKAATFDSLITKQLILNYSFSTKIREQWSEYDKEYVEQRIERQIPIKCLIPIEEEAIRLKKADANSYRETRLISKEDLPIACEINIYGNKVAYISFDPLDLYAVIIENDFIAKSHRHMFNMGWNAAEKISKAYDSVSSSFLNR